jgi:hypothetical protein
MPLRVLSSSLLLALFLGRWFTALGYLIGSKTLLLTIEDTWTGASPLSTLFLDENATIIVAGLSWTGADERDSVLKYQSFVNGMEMGEGSISLSEDPLSLSRINSC